MAEPWRGAEPLWRTPPERLAPPHVYRMAGALGAELRRLSGRFGPEAVAGLVPPVVRLLELLEALVAPVGAEGEAPAQPGGRQDAENPEQRLWEAEHRERALHSRLARLEEQNRQLLGQLAESQSQEDSTARKEREVMLRLKEVVDKQRDELRAQAHEIVCKSRDTEAVSVWELAGVVCEGPGDLLSCHLPLGLSSRPLQEQLHRFMAMNEDLRHKVAVVQAQLKSALEKKSDLEAAMLQAQRETSRRSRTSEIQRPKPSLEGAPSPAEEPQHQDAGRSPAHCCFSKEELQQILQERNELKTNLFLVQEELAYYQRELLNEERVPGFFLDAMKSTIKRQRKKIRAKMLGTTEESASSDEDEGSWFPARGTDCVDAQPPDSKIRSFFGLWYQGSSKDPSASSCSGAWEIIDSLDAQLELEGESEPAAGSPDRAVQPL
ncbi:rab-interacting lysosomal protein isoform X1 [Aquila chrysaetos chrysaetos]|uniref:rab-interacting lysosomal protein isoform X1 n=1 Tax=Aquila chrysaetos chrysaetos TaxID=223781 RepID=UPI001B7D3C49|nr:rab-interacting lysosomal protein isoform X1 [Aquila chrysaetos chrysaetos]